MHDRKIEQLMLAELNHLQVPAMGRADAAVTISADPLWRFLSTNLVPAQARERARVEGDERLVDQLFRGRAIVTSQR